MIVLEDFIPGQTISQTILESIRDSILLVQVSTGDVQYCNPAAAAMFRIKRNDVGVNFPEVLTLLGEPDPPHILRPVFYKKHLHDPKRRPLPVVFTDQREMRKRRITVNIMPSGVDDVMIVMLIDRTTEYDLETLHSDFVYLASHQLRTPLTAIKWYLKTYLDTYHDTLDKQQEHILTNVSYATNSMINLVEGLLNISRVETETDQLSLEEVDMTRLLRDVVKEMSPFIAQKQLNAVTDIHPSLPQVVVDKTMLKYVLINLLSNAINYSNTGGKLQIIITNPPKTILVQISDEGVGIPKNQQKEVFKRFFRADNARRARVQGSGLGLSLTKHIIESMGGQIWFDSTEGKGTTFWFTIPEQTPSALLDSANKVV